MISFIFSVNNNRKWKIWQIKFAYKLIHYRFGCKIACRKVFFSFFSVKHSGNSQHGEKTQFRFVQEYHLCKFCCFPISLSKNIWFVGNSETRLRSREFWQDHSEKFAAVLRHRGEDEKKGLELAMILKRNTRLNLFVRLLIAAGVGTLFVVAVERLLSEAFVAYWKIRGGRLEGGRGNWRSLHSPSQT